jgi:D-alanine-D-alanine ligase
MQVTQAQDFGRVAVVLGGTAAEREVSLNSGAAVLVALQSAGVNAEAFDLGRRSIAELISGGYDRVFNIVHGRGGEDGALQGALDLAAIPYTGMGQAAAALSMDKLTTKAVWQAMQLPTPGYRHMTSAADAEAVVAELGAPLMVKPAREGSSIGMARVQNAAELATAWQTAADFDPRVVVEQWVTGAEYTAVILQGQVLPTIRLETPNEFYDYHAKYEQNNTGYHCPSGLSDAQEMRCRNLALEAFEALGCSGWGRIDFMIDKDGEVWLLEANGVPGMTSHSLVPMAAKAVGVSFEELVWRILETSMTPAKAEVL